MACKLVQICANSAGVLVAKEDPRVSSFIFASNDDALKAKEAMGLSDDWLPMETEDSSPGLKVFTVE